MVQVCTVVASSDRRGVTATLIGADGVGAYLYTVVHGWVKTFIQIATSAVRHVLGIAAYTATVIAAISVDTHLVIADAVVLLGDTFVDVTSAVLASPSRLASTCAVHAVTRSCVRSACAPMSAVCAECVGSTYFTQSPGILEVAVQTLTHKAALRVAALRVCETRGTAGALVHVVATRRPSPSRLARARAIHVIAGIRTFAVALAGVRTVGAVIALRARPARSLVLVQ